MPGERTVDATLSRQAVVSYDAASQDHRQGLVPYDCAMPQNNLGNVLLELGEANCDHELLQQAMAAYQLALHERRQELMPLDWAENQSGLAQAELMLFKLVPNPSRLDAAERGAMAAHGIILTESEFHLAGADRPLARIATLRGG